jgi:hypothetical protein
MLSANIYSVCIRVAITLCCKDTSFSMLPAKITQFASGLSSLPAARKYHLACFQLIFTQFASGLPPLPAARKYHLVFQLKFTQFASGLPSLPAARIYHLACFQLIFTQFTSGLPRLAAKIYHFSTQADKSYSIGVRVAITPCCKDLSF